MARWFELPRVPTLSSTPVIRPWSGFLTPVRLVYRGRGLPAVALSSVVSAVEFCFFVVLVALVVFFPLLTEAQSFSNNNDPEVFSDDLFGCFAPTPDPFPTESTDISVFQSFDLCFDPYNIEDQIEVSSIDLGVWSFPGTDDEVEVWVRLWVDETGGAPTLDDRPGDVGTDPPEDNLLVEQVFTLEGVLDMVVVNLEFDDPVLVPCDETLVVEIFHARQSGDTDGDGVWDEDGDAFVIGNNAEDEESPSYVYREPCGDTEITESDLIFAPDVAHFLITVNYDPTGELCDCLGPDIDCQDPVEGGLEFLFKEALDFTSEPSGVISNDAVLDDVITVSGVDEDVIDMDVAVEITHDFAGDVTLELGAESGVSVTLYAGLAGAAPDIRCIFDDEGRAHGVPFFTGDRISPVGPGTLSDFDDEPVDGDWTLTASDSEPVDDGTLDSWSLLFNFPRAIPDDDADGTSLVLTVPDSLTEIIDVDVAFELLHALPTDLEVAVEGPDGTSVTIVDTTTLPADAPLVVARISDEDGDCDGGFGTGITSGPGSLSEFDGLSIGGDWSLTFVDTVLTNTGSVESWRLLIAPAVCAPPLDLEVTDSCSTDEVILSWSLPDGTTYDSIEILRDGESIIDDLEGDSTSFVDSEVDVGAHIYTVIVDCEPGRTSESVAVVHESCCAVGDVTVETDCTTGDVLVSWEIPTGVEYETINLLRNGVFVAELDGTTESYVELEVENGIHEYTVESVCEDPLGVNVASATLIHALHSDEEHLVWGPIENGVGLLDSAQVLFDILEELGETVLRIPSLDYPCMPDAEDYESLWVLLGTAPNNHPLSIAEGTLLAELVTGDVDLDDTIDNDPIALFIESADTWGGFDLPTDFADYDGIEQAVDDGDDSFTGMNGQSYRDLDLGDFLAVTYTQDQVIAFDWTDHLVPTGTTPTTEIDAGGAFAATIWEDDGSGGSAEAYSTGVLYQAVYEIESTEVANRIICQSWELAGFGGDLSDLVSRYVEALIPSEPPVADFTGTPTAGAAPLEVSFTDLSVDAKSWAWDFGDGETSEDQNPTHTYSEAGTYDVTLTVQGGGGSDVLLRKGWIVVSPDPGPQFIRGDADNNGVFSALLDGLYLLEYNFQGGDQPLCLDAADMDGDNSISLLLDALYGFQYAFAGGPEPPDPGTLACGIDDDGAGPGCEEESDLCN